MQEPQAIEAVHDIAQTIALYIEGTGPQLYFPDEAIEHFKKELAEMGDAHEMKRAMQSLVDLAAHFELDLQAAGAAKTLLEIAASAVPALKRAIARAERASREAAERFYADQSSDLAPGESPLESTADVPPAPEAASEQGKEAKPLSAYRRSRIA